MRLSGRDVAVAVIVAVALFLVWPFLVGGVVAALAWFVEATTGGTLSPLTVAAIDRQNTQYAIPVLAMILAGFGAPWPKRARYAGVLVGGLLLFDLVFAFAGVDWFIAPVADIRHAPVRTIATVFVYHTFDVVFTLGVAVAFIGSLRATRVR
jgi:hypothetical protein